MKINYEPAILWPGLSIGLCAIHPLFLFAVFISIYKYREPWINQINLQLSTYKWWYFAFPVFAFALGYLNVRPFVLDDLMFHVVAYQFSYDFRSLYAHASPLPTFNSWIGFEMFAGKLHQLLGPEYSVRAIQAMGVVLFYASFFFALHKILKERADKWLWCTIIFALCVSPISYRVFSGRLDIFFVAWLMSAVFLRPIIWLILGILIMPTYTLSVVYAPGALLLNTSWRNRIIYGVIHGASCIIFWYVYSSGEWLNLPAMYSIWAKNRVLGISEILSSINILGNMYFVGLLLLLYCFLHKASFKLTAQAIPFLLLIAYFLLPNFIRYIIILVPLVGLLCAIYVPRGLKLNPQWSLIVLIFASLISTKTVSSVPYENLPKFNIPTNAIVLTQFDEGIYSGILHNPHVKFAPAMEIGANDQAIQTLIGNLRSKGTIDCQELKKFSFTHIQENRLRTIPSCLNLSQVDGNWRLWEIK